MVYRIGQAVKKEFLLLKRDIGGLITLFVMPLVLVIVVTMIQDSAYRNISETKISIVLVNNDNGTVSQTVADQLIESGSFDIVTEIDQIKFTEEEARKAVLSGGYQMAVIIPEKLSEDLHQKVNQNVQYILTEFGLETENQAAQTGFTHKQIRLYFDPAVQPAFKIGIKNAIEKMVSEIEMQTVYNTFEKELGTDGGFSFDEKLISFEEISPNKSTENMPNSVQHNVPAWTLFAIFFIIVPLSINLIKERTQGTKVRLYTQPTPFITHLIGKTITYLIICLLQFYLILLVAIFLFPHLGLPHLDISNKLFLMTLVTLVSGLAAIGLGILLGTIARTQEQSSSFGSTFVVILAAMGGVWIPVFSMPVLMQWISKISPMSWALEGYYDVMLRNGNIVDILPEIVSLLVFFIIFALTALWYDKKKRAV